MKITAWGNAVRHAEHHEAICATRHLLESFPMNSKRDASRAGRTDQAESLSNFVNAEYGLAIAEAV